MLGGISKDSLNGGNDVFDFNALVELGLGATRDVITDFIIGQDKIDLSGIDADLIATGDQTFAFTGSATFTAAGQVRYAGGMFPSIRNRYRCRLRDSTNRAGASHIDCREFCAVMNAGKYRHNAQRCVPHRMQGLAKFIKLYLY